MEWFFQGESRTVSALTENFNATHMHHFRYTGDSLCCENVDLAAVAQLYGSPTYVYSMATMADNLERLRRGFGSLPVQVCYAAKANSSLAVLRHFARLGAGFDLVSGGELRRVLAAGADLRRSVFAGVGKTEAEIRLALEKGIFAFHVESEPELARINHVAGLLGVRAPVSFRINPDVDALTHAKVNTGRGDSKFGIPLRHAVQACEASARYKNVWVRGVQMHIGSQLTEIGPFTEAARRLAALAAELKSAHKIEYISVGGGLGIVYREALASGQASWWENQPAEKRPLTPEAYGEALAPILEPLGLEVMIEPGRFLVGNAGVLLTRVEYLKRTPGRNFLVVDAGMNDLVRPAMYDSYHEIVPLRRDTTRRAQVVDVVGPVCESSDCFARERQMQEVGEGEHVALMSAGAYGRSMASRYNSRSLPAEVMVNGSTFELVSARETFEQTIAGERIPAFLK